MYRGPQKRAAKAWLVGIRFAGPSSFIWGDLGADTSFRSKPLTRWAAGINNRRKENGATGRDIEMIIK